MVSIIKFKNNKLLSFPYFEKNIKKLKPKPMIALTNKNKLKKSDVFNYF